MIIDPAWCRVYADLTDADKKAQSGFACLEAWSPARRLFQDGVIRRLAAAGAAERFYPSGQHNNPEMHCNYCGRPIGPLGMAIDGYFLCYSFLAYFNCADAHLLVWHQIESGIMVSPVQVERLVAYAAKLSAAKFGEKGPIVAAATKELDMSKAEFYRQLDKVSVKPTRKRRSDAGKVSLPAHEAMLVAGLLMTGTRKNDKKNMSNKRAVETLRANHLIDGTRTNADGVVTKLSLNAITRAMRAHKVHPDQLNAPTPVTRMASNHPNHVWEIDASVCVMYYLPKSADPKKNGLRVMDKSEFYKNKPANVKKIENDMIWRYVVTDHTSGWVFVRYVFDGETGPNLADIFIAAICARGKNDPVHGVPLMVMLDPGSANTGAVFKNLCKSLQVHVQINKPKNPRAKGQVEQGQNLVECNFESSLCLVPVASLDELNAKAGQWMRWFNATQIHTRHRMTRYEAWLRITPDQLRIAPPAEICRELAVSAAVERTVTPELTIEFKGKTFKAHTIPGVLVGDKVQVVRNPWREDAAQVVLYDENGHETYHVLDVRLEGEFGFPVDAPVIGESYSRFKDTPAQTNRKTLERMVMGVDTDTEAAAARKARQLPFGGKIDPYKHQETSNVPTYLPKRGTESTVVAPLTKAAPLTHIKAALELVAMGVPMNPERNGLLRKWYPDGVPEAALDDIKNRLTVRANLRVVGE